MKKGIIAISLALVSSSFSANATTTTEMNDAEESRSALGLLVETTSAGSSGTPAMQDIGVKKSLAELNDPVEEGNAPGLAADIHIRPSHANDEKNGRNRTVLDAGKQDPALVHLDFDSVNGLNTPFTIPGESNEAYISSGLHGSAQMVECPPDCHEPHAVLMGTGDLQITFSSDVESARLIYRTGGSVEKLTHESPVVLSLVLLDATGKLVGSKVMDLGDDKNLLDIASDLPFRTLVLTPSSDCIWTISDVAIEGNNFAVPADAELSHLSLKEDDLKVADPSVNNSVKRPSAPNNADLIRTSYAGLGSVFDSN